MFLRFLQRRSHFLLDFEKLSFLDCIYLYISLYFHHSHFLYFSNTLTTCFIIARNNRIKQIVRLANIVPIVTMIVISVIPTMLLLCLSVLRCNILLLVLHSLLSHSLFLFLSLFLLVLRLPFL